MKNDKDTDKASIVEENETDIKISEPRIGIGVDEFTIVLQPVKKVDISLWDMIANEIIDEFLKKSELDHILGGVELTNRGLVQGYTVGYCTSVGRPYHSVVCYHDSYINMGVCFKMSAHAYYEYKIAYFETYNEQMNIIKFLRLVESNIYNLRVSRIDLTADFFDMPDPIQKQEYLHPNSIYNGLIRQQIKVVDHNDRKNIRKVSGINKDGVYETVYLGSKKGKSRGFLRIYDKKSEQIENHSYRLKEALSCESWVRFEACYKGLYAHQIGEMLLDKILIQSDEELIAFIAGKICDKYIFKFPDDTIVNFSEILLDIASGEEYEALACESPRDNSLEQSLKYIIKNSGLCMTLAKILYVYATENAVIETLSWIKKMFEGYFLEKESRQSEAGYSELDKWMKKHKETTQKQKLTDIFEAVEFEISTEENWFDGTMKGESEI